MTGRGTQYKKIELTPGINKNLTEYANETTWVDGDKVRFQNGRPQKIGGWVRSVASSFVGVCRDLFSWAALDSKKYVGLGTHKKLFVLDGGSYADITPIRQTSTPTNPFSTTSGSPIVNVDIAGHNAQLGDTIIISGASAIGGITPDGEYEITSIVDSDNFEITHSSNATSTVAGGGGTPTIDFLLQIGEEFNTAALGWGAGTWSSGTWGTPRTTSSLFIELRQWSLDGWGEDLIACVRGGKIYTWDSSVGTGTRATAITNAPDENNYALVDTTTRQLISFGCTNASAVFDPMLIRWTADEDFTNWTPAADNTAGSKRLEVGNELMGAVRTRGDILVFSDIAVYLMSRVGYPFIFGFDSLSPTAGLVSQHSAVNTEGDVYWMGRDAFYHYDGTIRQLSCTLEDVIFDSTHVDGINEDQKQMVFAGVNEEFSEVIWLYPSRDSTSCNRYVIYNYEEGVWYDGTIDRSTWESVRVFDKPIATSNAGVMYNHESGKDDDGSPMESYIESGQFDLGDGDNIMFIDQLIPDFQQTGNLCFEITTKKYPTSTESVTKQYKVGVDSGKVNMRAKGRQASVKVISDTTSGDYHLGSPRLALKPSGRR